MTSSNKDGKVTKSGELNELQELRLERVLKNLDVQPEAGVHAHRLIREKRKTVEDGAHSHLFVFPGGEVVITEQGGEHIHVLCAPSDDYAASMGSDHSHKLKLPNGQEAETIIGGAHPHTLLVETSTIDGMHMHGIVLPDGQIVRSLRPGEFWRFMGSPKQEGAEGLPPLTKVIEKKKNDDRIYKEDISEDQRLAFAALGYSIDDEIKKESDEGIAEEIPIMKINDEKRIVYGIVLEPEVVDDEDDIISKEEIQKTAHAFMKESRTIGFRHNKKSKASLVESSLIQKEFKIKGPFGTQNVKKGTWVIGVHVPDDKEWENIKTGKIQAFSVGGFGSRD